MSYFTFRHFRNSPLLTSPFSHPNTYAHSLCSRTQSELSIYLGLCTRFSCLQCNLYFIYQIKYDLLHNASLTPKADLETPSPKSSLHLYVPSSNQSFFVLQLFVSMFLFWVNCKIFASKDHSVPTLYSMPNSGNDYDCTY